MGIFLKFKKYFSDSQSISFLLLLYIEHLCTDSAHHKHASEACTEFYASQMNKKYVSGVSKIFLKFHKKIPSNYKNFFEKKLFSPKGPPFDVWSFRSDGFGRGR